MSAVEHIQVHPLLVEVPVDGRARVGIVSLIVVPPNHLSVCLISVHPDRDAGWVPPMLNLSCGGGPRLEPLGVGGGGGNGWMRWHADFLGQVPEPVEAVDFSFVSRASAVELAAITMSPRVTRHPDVDSDIVDDIDSLLNDDHDQLLPLSIAPVRAAIEGIENHFVVSIEHWPHTSVVLVYTPDEHQQTPSIAPIAVGRDSIGRTYDVRAESGGTWCRGAASHLRVRPRLSDDVDVLHLDWGGAPWDVGHATLRLR